MAVRTYAGGTHSWSQLAAWVEGVVPTAADDVVMNVNTTGTLTIDGTSGTPSLCRSWDCTGFTGTITHAGSTQLNIGDASGGSCVLASGMTYSPGTSTLILFVSTTTGNNITCNTKSFGPVQFNGSGGAWTLTDAFTASRDITVTLGAITASSTIGLRSLILNGGSLTAGGTITPTSTCTIAGGTLNCGSNTINGTGLTASSGTATINTWTGTGALSVTGATVTFNNTASFTSSSITAGSVSCTAGTFTCSSGSFGVTVTGSFDGTGQTINVTTALTMTSSGSLKAASLVVGTGLTITAGTTTVTGNVSGTTLTFSGSTVRNISMGNGTWTLSGTGATVFTMGTTPTNLTFNAGGSKIIISDTSASTKGLTFGGQTYNNLQINGAASEGLVTINDNGTFNNITLQADANVKIVSGKTITCSSLTATGTSGHSVLLAAVTPASPATISAPSGTIANNFMTLQDMSTAGGACFYAGANSTNTSGNSGWIFATVPPSGQSFVSGGF